MIRIGAFLVGLFFSGWLLVSAAMGAFAFVTAPTAPTAAIRSRREAASKGIRKRSSSSLPIAVQ